MKAWFFVIVGLSILIPYAAGTIYVDGGTHRSDNSIGER